MLIKNSHFLLILGQKIATFKGQKNFEQTYYRAYFGKYMQTFSRNPKILPKINQLANSQNSQPAMASFSHQGDHKNSQVDTK